MAESEIDKWRRKNQQMKQDPASEDRVADRQARLIMTAINVFDPLVSAALWSKREGTDPVVAPGDDFVSSPETFQDKINTVSRLWGMSIELVSHIAQDFRSIGVDLLDPNNRWMYRKLIPAATRMIGKAEVNDKQFNLEAIKRSYSAVGTMVLGRALPGVGDESQAQQLVEKYAGDNNDFLKAMADNEGYYTLDKTEAARIAKLNALSEIAYEVEEFSFFQGAKGDLAKHEIKGRLSQILDKAAASLFRLTIGIDENGEPNDAYAMATSDESRRMLMMRCIGEAGHYICRSYQKHAGQAIRDVLQHRGNESTYKAAQMHYYSEGVPFESIEKEVNESVQVLSSAAISGSAYLNQLMDNPLLEESNQESSVQTSISKAETKESTEKKIEAGEQYTSGSGNHP